MSRKTDSNSATSRRKEGKKGKKAGTFKEATAGFFSDFRYGKTVSVSFFRNNVWLLLIFIVIVIALMGMRYKTKTKMEQIKRLEKELVESESDKLREKAAYMSLIRETEMLRLVNKNHLNLIFQEEPPYESTLTQDN